MRSLWKGAISFGLVNIPVHLYLATQRQDVHLRTLHAPCKSPVRYQKVCPSCGVEVPREEIVWGYEYERGRFALLQDEELESLPLPTAHTIEIQDFVQLAEIDPLYFDRSYYLEPAEGGAKPYGLLREAMEESGRVAVAQVALRTRESLAAIRTMGRVLVLETMFYADEIRPAGGLAGLQEEAAPSQREVALARQIIDNLTAPFDPAAYRSRHREALHTLIQSKIEGREVAEPAPAPAAGKVVDLMAALEASLRETAGNGKARGNGKGRRRQTARRVGG